MLFGCLWLATIRMGGVHYGDYALPIQQRRRDGLVLKHYISELVN